MSPRLGLPRKTESRGPAGKRAAAPKNPHYMDESYGLIILRPYPGDEK